MRAPTLVLGTVVTLSTITRHAARKPLRSFGTTGRRNRGASVGSVVKAQIVIESVASKLLSCTMTTGRGFRGYSGTRNAFPQLSQTARRATIPYNEMLAGDLATWR